jgi:hypothetical protein
LNSDAYRIVKEHDSKARRTAYVARISSTPDNWSELVSDAVHGLRSALDHLAFALNEKGYADAHNGAGLPAKDANASAFPIFGNESNEGKPMDGEHAFRSDIARYRHIPAGALRAIEELQPYKRGDDFRLDPLWAIHALSRVDKHRIDLEITASQPSMHLSHAYFPAVSDAAIGIGGPVYDGKELTYWVIPEGADEPDFDSHFARGVAFGERTPLREQPAVRTLLDIRNYLRYKVAFPLDRFL